MNFYNKHKSPLVILNLFQNLVRQDSVVTGTRFNQRLPLRDPAWGCGMTNLLLLSGNSYISSHQFNQIPLLR
jgi:hypothetical protein